MARPRTDIAPRILRAARQRFREKGVDGSSLRAVAKDAGTSIGMIYYYFPTKDELFFAVVEETYERLLADLGEALARDRPLEERLSRLYERLARATADELDIVRLVVQDGLLGSPRSSGSFSASSEATCRSYSACYSRASATVHSRRIAIRSCF